MSNPEFEKFDSTIKRILSVPREELQRREKEWKRKQARKKRAKAKASPASRASGGKVY
jgi:U3 small nucleolar ribonucleoprotein component